MSQLFFKQQFHAAIRAGTKTTTIRRWLRPRVTEGRDAYVLRLGWLRIEKVERIELDSLDETDAQSDGFATRAVMIQSLKQFYPVDQNDGKQWFRISFQLREPIATSPPVPTLF